MSKTIYVACPFCEGMLEIDPEKSAVVAKWGPGEKGKTSEEKMSDALKKLEDGKKRRANLFDKTREAMEDQKKKLDNVFKDEVDRVKKEGVKENPIRPFDLD